jgi:hypothetical protein
MRPAIAVAAAGSALFLGACGDYYYGPTYLSMCQALADKLEPRCRRSLAKTSPAERSEILDCEVAQLARAGFYAINHENELRCFSPHPFADFQISGGLYDRCPYRLLSAEGDCEARVAEGQERTIKDCVLKTMRTANFTLGRDYFLRPGSPAAFQCAEEMQSKEG